MAVSGMNHFTVLTDDVPRTVDFYARFLGLTNGPRPDLGFPGAWLYADGAAVLHVVGGKAREHLRSGVIDHMAFTAKGLADTIASLVANNVEHTCRQQIGTRLWQVFFFDPNGARVELDFPADEVTRGHEATPPMMPIAVEPDHLVVGALSLEQGCDWIEQVLGVRPQPGGQHVAMGTHNAVLSLGPRFYLEVIAVDPNGVRPAWPRWFDLDEPRMKAALAEGPQLVHWAARTAYIDAAAARLPDLGTPTPMTRGEYSWRITIPADGHRPGRGLVPTLIQWSGTRHPADRLPDTGLRLAALAGEHPEPAKVRADLATLDLSETLKVTYAKSPRLAAMIRTARGVATL